MSTNTKKTDEGAVGAVGPVSEAVLGTSVLHSGNSEVVDTPYSSGTLKPKGSAIWTDQVINKQFTNGDDKVPGTILDTTAFALSSFTSPLSVAFIYYMIKCVNVSLSSVGPLSTSSGSVGVMVTTKPPSNVPEILLTQAKHYLNIKMILARGTTGYNIEPSDYLKIGEPREKDVESTDAYCYLTFFCLVTPSVTDNVVYSLLLRADLHFRIREYVVPGVSSDNVVALLLLDDEEYHYVHDVFYDRGSDGGYITLIILNNVDKIDGTGILSAPLSLLYNDGTNSYDYITDTTGSVTYNPSGTEGESYLTIPFGTYGIGSEGESDVDNWSVVDYQGTKIRYTGYIVDDTTLNFKYRKAHIASLKVSAKLKSSHLCKATKVYSKKLNKLAKVAATSAQTGILSPFLLSTLSRMDNK